MNVQLVIKKLFFPGLDIGAHKRLKFTKYFRTGDILTLDAGCGNGAFSFAAAQNGNRVIGVDFDPEKLGRTARYRDYLGLNPARVRFEVGSVYDLGSANSHLNTNMQQFDQIICFETMEHLKDDTRALHILGRLLAPHGVLHLCTPSRDRTPYYGEIISDIEDGGHVRLGYSLQDFETMLAREGFEIIAHDTAVGAIGQAIINIMNWMDHAFLNHVPARMRDIGHMIVFLVLYPFTFFDAIIPSNQLNVYVMAQKKLSTAS